jgi:hypothetical protein
MVSREIYRFGLVLWVKVEDFLYPRFDNPHQNQSGNEANPLSCIKNYSFSVDANNAAISDKMTTLMSGITFKDFSE